MKPTSKSALASKVRINKNNKGIRLRQLVSDLIYDILNKKKYSMRRLAFHLQTSNKVIANSYFQRTSLRFSIFCRLIHFYCYIFYFDNPPNTPVDRRGLHWANEEQLKNIFYQQ